MGWYNIPTNFRCNSCGSHFDYLYDTVYMATHEFGCKSCGSKDATKLDNFSLKNSNEFRDENGKLKLSDYDFE